jgi:hypothetical protein
MNERRILPYVEMRTLDDLISRFGNRRTDYLIHIARKMVNDGNRILVPPIPSLGVGVYELLSLSLEKGRELPIVSPKVFLESTRPEGIISTIDGDGISLVYDNGAIVIERNNNVNAFIDWIGKNGTANDCVAGSWIYKALMVQSQKDEERRIARLN